MKSVDHYMCRVPLLKLPREWSALQSWLEKGESNNSEDNLNYLGESIMRLVEYEMLNIDLNQFEMKYNEKTDEIAEENIVDDSAIANEFAIKFDNGYLFYENEL